MRIRLQQNRGSNAEVAVRRIGVMRSLRSVLMEGSNYIGAKITDGHRD
jgi:hypothetical protein